MSNVDKILNVARSLINCKESNGSHKQIIDVYNSYTPLPRNYKVKYTDSWCMTFISACFIKAGLAALCPLECSCGNAITKAKSMGIWQEKDDITPNVGDLIMYDWNKADGWPEHVGIVESVTNNQITVIEGNKSNAVGRRVINVGNASIRGYIQPNYDGSISNNQPSKPISNEKAVNYKVKVNTKSGVNCRTEPNIDGAKITAYANGIELTITKELNGWGYANNTGWVSLEYCKKITNASSNNVLGNYKVVASDLIVRDAPNGRPVGHGGLSTDGKKHDKDSDGALDYGTIVTISKIQDGWGKCPSGWVSMKYLQKV